MLGNFVMFLDSIVGLVQYDLIRVTKAISYKSIISDQSNF